MDILDMYIKAYVDIQKREDELKEEKEAARKGILENMTDKKYENDEAKVTIAETRKFDYLDETAMIAKLKELGHGDMVKEVIKTTELNKLLKDKPEDVVSRAMTENNLVKEKLTETLTVKKK